MNTDFQAMIGRPTWPLGQAGPGQGAMMLCAD